MIGEVIAERYEVLGVVGTGGMSSVYKAHDQLLERNVALKVLHAHFGGDEEHVARFRREAQAVAQLSHPNIVTVIDRGEADGRQFIVFELIEGENLKELVERTGPLPVRRAVELTLAVARGLAFAHEHGLVHRDVKPQNVLLNGEGEAKVTDFGIARSLDVEHGVTQTGTVLGTSNYLSPEQASGLPVTPATDVYSLGVVLYELLTAEVPFPGDNFVVVAMKHRHDAVPNILERRPDVPVRLAAALERALEKDPAQRFSSMREFAAELERCLDGLGSWDSERTFVAPQPGLRQSAPSRTRARRRRRPVLIVLALVLAAAAITAGVLALDGSHGNKPPPSVAPGVTAAVHAVGSYDPQSDGGDGSEHNTGLHSVTDATDGDPATYWTTDIYNSANFGGLKPGVGLVLDAGSAVALRSLAVTTDTPGFTAKIQAGDSISGPFADDSATRTVNGATTFALSGTKARYYVVWLTRLPPGDVAHVNAVTAKG
jgi:eukaryotic-like serine/threonine-protein kinase